jgi:membrane protein
LKTLDNIRTALERIGSAPGEELGRWARLGRFQLRLWRFCARRLWENNVAAMSAALSYRTVFALVPVIVLAVVVMKSLGMLEDGKQSLRQLLASSGFEQITIVHPPESEEAGTSERLVSVADELEDLVARVESKLTLQRVGPVGVVLLIWTALTLLTTMERSLNRIFRAHQPRPLVRRLLLYWAVVTLGPLAAVATRYAGQRLIHAFESTSGLSWLLVVAGWIGPILIGILLLASVYALLPHTRVGFRCAVSGAAVAVPFWLVAKWGFGVYVTRLVGTDNLYGTLGVIPLFLIWLNLSWWIFLFGAQLARAAANLATMEADEQEEAAELAPADLMAAAIAVARTYTTGQGPAGLREVAGALGRSTTHAERVLDKLSGMDILCQVDGAKAISYVPARPLDQIRVMDILGVREPGDRPADSALCEPGIRDMLARTWNHARTVLHECTLAAVLATETAKTPAAEPPQPPSSA